MTIIYIIQSKIDVNFDFPIFCFLLCIDFFYVVTFFDRGGLYCSSKNLFITFTEVTPFCVISGSYALFRDRSKGVWLFFFKGLYTVEPPLKDPPKKGQALIKDTS